MNLFQRDFQFTKQFFDKVEADKIFVHLKKLPFQEEKITLFGKIHTVPRKVLWVADPGVEYKYSGKNHAPTPWNKILTDLRDKVQETAKTQFNGLLLNYYADGSDYMGWHSDNEKELGSKPIICSLSFGAERRFLIRSKKDRSKEELLLTHGSLLTMRENSQHDFQHCLPKMRKVYTERINLTFRKIISLQALTEN